jgi:hypothetical protein
MRKTGNHFINVCGSATANQWCKLIFACLNPSPCSLREPSLFHTSGCPNKFGERDKKQAIAAPLPVHVGEGGNRRLLRGEGEKTCTIGYYEHIIRDEESLDSTRLYSQTNPAQWDADSENPANMKV